LRVEHERNVVAAVVSTAEAVKAFAATNASSLSLNHAATLIARRKQRVIGFSEDDAK